MRRGKIVIELEITGDFDEGFLGYTGHAVVGRARDAMTPGVRQVSRASWFTEMIDDQVARDAGKTENGCRWNVTIVHMHRWTLTRKTSDDNRWEKVRTIDLDSAELPDMTEGGKGTYQWEEQCLGNSFLYQRFMPGQFPYSEQEPS